MAGTSGRVGTLGRADMAHKKGGMNRNGNSPRTNARHTRMVGSLRKELDFSMMQTHVKHIFDDIYSYSASISQSKSAVQWVGKDAHRAFYANPIGMCGTIWKMAEKRLK